MGISQGKLEKHQDAIDSYLKAIKFGEKASDWGTVASAYSNMGISQGKLEKYQDAIDSYLKAIESREFLPDRGERIFPNITLLICILGTKNIQEKNHNQAKELTDKLAQVYLDGEKDGMSKLIVKTMEIFESKQSKEDKNTFQEFKQLFEKSKKDIRDQK
jgi:tetratricopeptide (TPR) repeat protein